METVASRFGTNDLHCSIGWLSKATEVSWPKLDDCVAHLNCSSKNFDLMPVALKADEIVLSMDFGRQRHVVWN